jgi:outer membrane protein TolC
MKLNWKGWLLWSNQFYGICPASLAPAYYLPNLYFSLIRSYRAKGVFKSLAIAKDRLSIAKADVTISKLTEKPFVGLKASVGSRNGYLPAINDPRFNYNAGIGITIPLFNGGKIKQQIKVQERGMELTASNVDVLIHDTEKDIHEYLFQYHVLIHQHWTL